MSKLRIPRLTRTEKIVVFSLLALSFIPSAGGVFRVFEMSTGGDSLPPNPRMEANPLPITVHILSSVLFSVIGIFQFLPSLRNQYSKRHRFFGRVFVIASIIAGVTGLWMTNFYEFPRALQGELLYWVRILVGMGMIYFTLRGLMFAVKRQFSSHMAWMIRAYALGQGAGMQAITGIIWSLIGFESEGLSRDLVMTASWCINLIIAELIIVRLRRASF